MKKFTSVFLTLMMCFLMLPVGTNAATTVSVKPNSGKTVSYSGKKTSCYVNKKKINLSKTPIFLKNNSYVGPVTEIFKKSSLKVKITSSKDQLTMVYGKNTLKLKNNSKTVYKNGKRDTIGSAPIYGTYTSSKQKRWIVPLLSVCSRLGINYKLDGSIYISEKTPATTETKPETKPAAPKPKEKITLVLDAGHGGTDAGAVGNKLSEKNLNLAIVLGAKKYFDKDDRFQVYYTRTKDTYPSLSQRCDLANKKKADFFISVHINSASASAKGTETLLSKNRNSVTTKKGLTSNELATAMHNGAYQAMKKILPVGYASNRGLRDRPNLYVLKHTNMPACLIEYGFISNKTEANAMNKHTSELGKSLYDSVVSLMKQEKRY